jgi:hypothetical protein
MRLMLIDTCQSFGKLVTSNCFSEAGLLPKTKMIVPGLNARCGLQELYVPNLRLVKKLTGVMQLMQDL